MFNWATISPIKCPWIHGVKWSWTVFKNLCKTGNKTNASEITLWNWFGAYHTLAISFCKGVLIFKFHLLVFVCMFAIFLIINTSFLIYLYNDYFPFSLKATYCTLILHDSMVFFGSLTFLFLFYFQGVQCMPEFGWVFIHCKKCLMFMVWMGLIWCNSYC